MDRLVANSVLVGVASFFILLTLSRGNATVLTFEYTAVLFENYGTISAGQQLTGTFSYDSAAGSGIGIPGISLSVNHATEGSLSSSNVVVNVFNNAFGNTTDAVAIQGLAPVGVLGNVSGGSNFLLDFRGPTSVFSGNSLPTSEAVYAALTTATLLLPYPPNVNAVSGFATIVSVTLSEVPLPAALPLFASGLGVLGVLIWRRKSKAKAAMRAKPNSLLQPVR